MRFTFSGYLPPIFGIGGGVNRRTISQNHWTASQSDSWLVLQAPRRNLPDEQHPVLWTQLLSNAQCVNCGYRRNRAKTVLLKTWDSAFLLELWTQLKSQWLVLQAPAGPAGRTTTCILDSLLSDIDAFLCFCAMESCQCGCTGEANQIIGLSLSVEFGNPVVLF